MAEFMPMHVGGEMTVTPVDTSTIFDRVDHNINIDDSALTLDIEMWDINGDGYDDMVMDATVLGESEGVIAYMGRWNGIDFQNQKTIYDGGANSFMSTSELVQIDTNGDGENDALLYSRRSTIELLQPGDNMVVDEGEVMTISEGEYRYKFTNIGDVNGDGADDLAALTLNNRDQLKIYMSNVQDSTFAGYVESDINPAIEDFMGKVVGLDNNNDGRTDQIFALKHSLGKPGTDLVVLQRQQDNTFYLSTNPNHLDLFETGTGSSIGLIDVDNDHDKDLVVGMTRQDGIGDQKETVVYFNENGNFGDRTELPLLPGLEANTNVIYVNIKQVQETDVNNNGKNEIMVVGTSNSPSEIAFYEYDTSSQSFVVIDHILNTEQGSTGHDAEVVLGKIDNDNDYDLAFGDERVTVAGLRVWENKTYEPEPIIYQTALPIIMNQAIIGGASHYNKALTQ